jgi:hypothetical protein
MHHLVVAGCDRVAAAGKVVVVEGRNNKGKKEKKGKIKQAEED